MSKLIARNFQLIGVGKISTKNFRRGLIEFNCLKFSTLDKENKSRQNLNEFRQNFRKNNLEEKSNKRNDTNSIFSNREEVAIPLPASNTNKPFILKSTTNKYEKTLKEDSDDKENELMPQPDLIPNIRARGYFERDPNDKTTP
jgi:hypothetical protein